MGEDAEPSVILKALILCERVDTDPETGRLSLIHLFDEVAASRFPVEIRLGLYGRVMELYGRGQFRVDVVVADTGDPIAQVLGAPIEVSNPLRPCEFVLPCTFTVAAPMQLEFRLFVNDRYVNSVMFDVVSGG